MAKKSLNMIEKMMDPNIIDYYIINCAIPSQSKIVTKSILASLGYRILEQREFDQRFDSFLYLGHTLGLHFKGPHWLSGYHPTI